MPTVSRRLTTKLPLTMSGPGSTLKCRAEQLHTVDKVLKSNSIKGDHSTDKIVQAQYKRKKKRPEKSQSSLVRSPHLHLGMPAGKTCSACSTSAFQWHLQWACRHRAESALHDFHGA
ncbi:hypothetical protein CEXT_76101 [Caerostris extrusa]|uniref:Uncharacterized protein n=1 Tax=Caerostris extrusa TaxID=172846 RepID=A0AAV4WA67_CAEEX|nr:hypothetical protein CEXT_76101 [Caerostris extrusa]